MAEYVGVFFQEKEITFLNFIFQLLQTFQKYKELIKHPNISKELLFERETLLARLQDYVKGKNVFNCISFFANTRILYLLLELCQYPWYNFVTTVIILSLFY